MPYQVAHRYLGDREGKAGDNADPDQSLQGLETSHVAASGNPEDQTACDARATDKTDNPASGERDRLLPSAVACSHDDQHGDSQNCAAVLEDLEQRQDGHWMGNGQWHP